MPGTAIWRLLPIVILAILTTTFVLIVPTSGAQAQSIIIGPGGSSGPIITTPGPSRPRVTAPRCGPNSYWNSVLRTCVRRPTNTQPTPRCRPGFVLRGGRCVPATVRPTQCRPGYVLNRQGRCVPVVRPCPAGYHRVRGKCVPIGGGTPEFCPPGQKHSRGRCVPIDTGPKPCAYPKVRNRRGRCVCPGGYNTVRGRCVKIDRRPECRPPLTWSRRLRRCIPPVIITPPPVERRCEYPWISVPGRSGCFCADGYEERRGRCIREVEPIRCERPWVYSSRSGGCICPSGHTIIRGECVKRETRTCQAPWVYSKSQRRCVCRSGYHIQGNRCVKDDPGYRPGDIVRIQDCLNKLGYEAGPADGKPGRKTKRAWDQFRRDHNLTGRSSGYDDRVTTNHLFRLCEKPPKKVEEPPVKEKVVEKVSYERCVSRDIYELMTKTYGRRPDIKVCGAVDECVPIPPELSEREIVRLERERGVKWCRSCIQLGAYLPLGDILRIEGASGLQICAARPPSYGHCVDRTRTIYKTRVITKIRTLYRDLPRGYDNEGNVAVIVGNTAYGGALTVNENADRDAEAFKAALIEQLGYREENIIDLRDAKLADLRRVFGTRDDHKSELWDRLERLRNANVIIYYSGHGGTTGGDGASYLLPVDAEADREAETAYPVDVLYENLRKLNTRSIMLLLEADFAREAGALVLPPNLAEKDVKVMPTSPVPGLAIYTASDRDQRTLEDPDFGIGLFTRYVIEGLSGKADEAPLGNGDKTVDTVELYAYASSQVRLAARKSFGLTQKPLLGKTDNLVFNRLGKGN